VDTGSLGGERLGSGALVMNDDEWGIVPRISRKMTEGKAA
jgi:hypothetical protein